MNDFSSDTFFNDRLRIRQYKSGYRFSIDAIFLSYYAGLYGHDVVLDLGTGCGVIPLIMAYRNPKLRIYGVEVQKELAEIAAFNVKDNQMADRIIILCQDMVTLTKKDIPLPIDMVVCNPPYRKRASGRINPNTQRAVARHEIQTDLSGILNTASRILDISGRFITIYPAVRTAEILSQMHASGLEPKFLRMIHSFHHSNSSFVLVEARQGGNSGLTIGPPLFIYQNDGRYTEEIENMFLPNPVEPELN